MEKIIYLSSGDLFKAEIEKIKGGFQIFRARNLRDALIFLINNPEVGAILYTVTSSSQIDKKTMEVLAQLNPLLPIVIIQKEVGKFNQKQLMEWNGGVMYQAELVTRADWPTPSN